MNRFRFISSLIILSFSCLGTAYSQDDFGLDFSASAEKKICRGTSFTLEGFLRTQDKTSSMERWGFGGSFDFKVLNTKKFDLKLSAGWEFIRQYSLDEKEDKYDEVDDGKGTIKRIYKGYNLTKGFWRPRHRTTFAVGANYSPNKRWSFSLKESVQYNHFGTATTIKQKYRTDSPEIEPELDKEEVDDKPAKDRFVLRSKLTVKYDIRHSHFAPFASVDYGCGLNYAANKWKFIAGTDYNLNKSNKFSLYYRFQTENDDDEPNGHIVGLSYGFKF